MRTPDLPMMEPIRICGMRRRSGYVFDWDVEGDSRGSLLSVRIMSPNAWEESVLFRRKRATNQVYLGDCILRSTDSQDAFHGAA